MAKLTPAEYTEKWGRNLKNASTDIKRGIERVSEAPGAKAAKASGRMLAGIQEAIQSGKWQRAVASVSLTEWQEAAINKGIGRIAAGVDGAHDKQVQMATKLLAAVDSVGNKVRAMPNNTFEERLQRSVEFQRGMHAQQIK